MIIGPFNSGIAAGGAGVATANLDTRRITGIVRAMYVRYNDAPPAGTTDIVIKTKGDSAPSYNLLAIANAATDGIFHPCKQAVDQAGAVVAGVFESLPVDDALNVAIAQANNGDSIDIWLYLE